MFNTAAKVQYGLAAAALVLAVVYGFAINDPTGFVLLLGMFAAFTLGAMAVSASGVKDRAPAYANVFNDPPLQTVVVDHSIVPPNPWPLVTGVAVAIFGVGVAVSVNVVIVGVIACLIAAAGWFGQSWREDPTYTAREGERITDRLLGPFGMPFLAVTLIGIIIVSLSRVLLAVPKKASVAVALGAAIVVLAVFYFLSTRPRLGRGLLALVAGFSLVALIVAGGVSVASGYRTFDHQGTPPPIKETAKNTTYLVKAITVIAGQPAQITFRNVDPGVYHNMAVYTSNPDGSPIWTGEPIKGVRTITYVNVFPKAGNFAFRCDFHPTVMTGTFDVVNP